MRRSVFVALSVVGALLLLFGAGGAFVTWSVLRANRCATFLQAGEIALTQNQLGQAKSSYTAALACAIWPVQTTLAYAGRARVELMQSHNDAAIHDYTKGLARNTRVWGLYSGRGMAWQRKGDYKKALSDYAAALRQNPNDSLVFLNRCTIYELQNDRKRALADLNEAIRCSPQAAEAFAGRGFLLTEAHQNDAALADLDTALRLNPSLATAYRNRSTIFFRRAKYDRADADSAAAEACESLDSSNSLAAALASESDETAHLFSDAAELATSAHAYEEAITLYGMALASPNLIPHNRAVYRLNRGVDYSYLNEYQKAVTDYDAAIAARPSYYGAYVDRASAYYYLDEKDRAIADGTEAIRLNPQSGEAYGVRAEAYSLDKQTVAAFLADSAKAISLLPRYTVFYNDRATLLLAYRQPHAAWPDIEMILKLLPKSTEGYSLKGHALDQMGEFDGADQAYRQRLALSSKGASYYLNQFAWFYATCPDPAVRDAKLAIRLASQACSQTDWRNADERDTLAAAYAAAGDFVQAIDNQLSALACQPAEDQRAGMQARLALYQQHKPYVNNRTGDTSYAR